MKRTRSTSEASCPDRNPTGTDMELTLFYLSALVAVAATLRMREVSQAVVSSTATDSVRIVLFTRRSVPLVRAKRHTARGQRDAGAATLPAEH